MNMIKGILVDPVERTVTSIEIENDYKAMQAVIGCRCFSRATVIGNDDVWCDDEGLLTADPILYLTKINAYPDPIAGRLLLLGHTWDGDGADVSMSIDEFLADQDPHFGYTVAL